MEHAQPPEWDRGHLLFGLALIVVGVAMLLERFTPLDFDGRLWPFTLLLLMGTVKLVAPSRSGQVRRSRRPGAWLIFIGLWGLVNEFYLFGLDYGTSWPLMIVGAGIMVVWRALEGPETSAYVRGRQEP